MRCHLPLLVATHCWRWMANEYEDVCTPGELWKVQWGVGGRGKEEGKGGEVVEERKKRKDKEWRLYCYECSMGDKRECSCEGSVAGLLCLASLLSVIKSQTLSLLLMCVCSQTFVVLEYVRNASDLNWFLCSHTHTLLYWHLAVFSHTHTLVLAPHTQWRTSLTATLCC